MEAYFGVLFAITFAWLCMFIYIASRGGKAYDRILFAMLSLLAKFLGGRLP